MLERYVYQTSKECFVVTVAIAVVLVCGTSLEGVYAFSWYQYHTSSGAS